MAFTIYPAIDIRSGRCVRLFQGDYDQETVYADSPFNVAKVYAAQGAEWLHVVDLDGAKEGRPVNDKIIGEIAKNLSMNVQVGGGIRNEATIKAYLEAGVDRIILGSAAISDQSFVKSMVKKYGEQIAIGIDAKEGMVAVEGWLETSTTSAKELAKELTAFGAKTFIFTDIAKDGTLSGPNIHSIVEIAEATGQRVIASGGVSSLADVKALKAHQAAGVSGAIIGKALYTKQIPFMSALEVAEADAY
ncbi:1-(5-phosphoribosyl)-5-[(5-phosphoribosylamino)methylideneamino]imidazole-4-carboxamide isomerase [Tuberibacillus sp. Marseille-P3662]|uniref:1-(5-phosphoribosyl)-5-[(5- phosphoribosylamino)methylideneamino]imidazole-4- carboxamide isomerase n=1 Tax=Tuberibacillus sp. Marseille-P3662 TaxID=1965358 RepID=UPI000A1CA9C1|nr:1-(5-phosphoribosyl)-5-[(5-phosphoribosylamino)methylideneamino]imidazole-4-carboxamide isomerase [Tuberibacillus sp. Marseille-P3662]